MRAVYEYELENLKEDKIIKIEMMQEEYRNVINEENRLINQILENLQNNIDF